MSVLDTSRATSAGDDDRGAGQSVRSEDRPPVADEDQRHVAVVPVDEQPVAGRGRRKRGAQQGEAGDLDEARLEAQPRGRPPRTGASTVPRAATTATVSAARPRGSRGPRAPRGCRRECDLRRRKRSSSSTSRGLRRRHLDRRARGPPGPRGRGGRARRARRRALPPAPARRGRPGEKRATFGDVGLGRGTGVTVPAGAPARRPRRTTSAPLLAARRAPPRRPTARTSTRDQRPLRLDELAASRQAAPRARGAGPRRVRRARRHVAGGGRHHAPGEARVTGPPRR